MDVQYWIKVIFIHIPVAFNIVFMAFDVKTSYGVNKLHNTGYQIMGTGEGTQQQLARFLIIHNPQIDLESANCLANIYIHEADIEGINHDIAFVQMCLETGFLKFRGITQANQYNYSGLGAVNKKTSGVRFQSMLMGITAHIQHLKAYACTDTLNGEPVDNRFKFVKRGCAPTIFQLARRWASDPQYGYKLKKLLDRLFEMKEKERVEFVELNCEIN